MITVELSDEFEGWLDSLKDKKAKIAVIARLRRLELGNFGDCKSVGDNLFEMRVHLSPGYRNYYIIPQENYVQILCGGTKDTQKRDIAKAKEILSTLRGKNNE